MNKVGPDHDEEFVPASALYYPPPIDTFPNTTYKHDYGSTIGDDFPPRALPPLPAEVDGQGEDHESKPKKKSKKSGRNKEELNQNEDFVKNNGSVVSAHLLYNEPVSSDVNSNYNHSGAYDDTMQNKLAQQGRMDTTMTRKQLTNGKKVQRESMYGFRHATRDKMDEDTIEEAIKRGLYINSKKHQFMDELEQLKQLEIVRMMPVNINVKRQLRDKVLEVPIEENSGGCCKTYCFRAKVERMRRARACKMACLDLDHSVTLWSKAFKRIEGNFGSGVLTYFQFLKWLFQLNIFIAIIHFLFVTLPMIIFSEGDYDYNVTGDENITAKVNLSLQCSALYTVNETSQWYAYILDFIQGTGYMEKSVLFYGYYVASELDISGSSYDYNMPLAYLICVLVYFIVSLFVMVHITAGGFRERVFMNHGDFNQFANKVFGGWDFTIDNEQNGALIHVALHREISSLLEEERHAKRRDERTCCQECGINSLRTVIWIGVLLALAGAGYFIYWITLKQSELARSSEFEDYHILVQLMIEFLTSATITVLNAILPFIFKLVVELEDYPGGLKVNITLARTVFLKLASLVVLVVSIVVEINCSDKDICGVGQNDCTPHRCWETYMGQEFYKLTIINLGVQFAVVFLIETPRRLVVDKCSNKLTKLLGRQEFDISKGVLDLIYMQAILWFGSFFCPLIPEMTVVIMFLIFYFKYFTVIWNCEPLHIPYRASEAQEFFLITLLVTYTLCIAPLVYIIYLVAPSIGCGPFRIYPVMYDIIPITIETWPSVIQAIVDFVKSAAVIVPIFVILCLTVYYLAQVLATYKEMVSILKEQLNLEGKEKDYLLKKLREAEEGEHSTPLQKTKKPTSAKNRKLKSAKSKQKQPEKFSHQNHVTEDPESSVVDSQRMSSQANRKNSEMSIGGHDEHDNYPLGIPHHHENSPDNW